MFHSSYYHLYIPRPAVYVPNTLLSFDISVVHFRAGLLYSSYHLYTGIYTRPQPVHLRTSPPPTPLLLPLMAGSRRSEHTDCLRRRLLRCRWCCRSSDLTPELLRLVSLTGGSEAGACWGGVTRRVGRAGSRTTWVLEVVVWWSGGEIDAFSLTPPRRARPVGPSVYNARPRPVRGSGSYTPLSTLHD